MHVLQTALILLALSFCVSCTSIPAQSGLVAPNLLQGNPMQVRAKLLGCIPIGTPRVEAERLVEQLGMERTPQVELSPGAVNSIHCRHTTKNGLFGQSTWLIQIDCPNGVVEDVFCEQIGL